MRLSGIQKKWEDHVGIKDLSMPSKVPWRTVLSKIWVSNVELSHGVIGGIWVIRSAPD